MIEERINQDLKEALLAGDKITAVTLRSLKSSILYAKVASGAARDEALDSSVLFGLLQKEAKKRQESADLYARGGRPDRAEGELTEKKLIERYLPSALNEKEINDLVDKTIDELESAQRTMGSIIAKVREKSMGPVDGAVVARIVKERLQK